MNEEKNTESEEPQGTVVARAAIEYLNEHGLFLTASFSEENPPSKEVEAFLWEYIDEAADGYSLEAIEDAIEMIEGDWLEDYEDENGGHDELLQ